jgi:hypothetical protein
LQGRIIQLEKDKENLQSEVSKVKFAQENVGSRKENQRHEVQETGTVTSHGETNHKPIIFLSLR